MTSHKARNFSKENGYVAKHKTGSLYEIQNKKGVLWPGNARESGQNVSLKKVVREANQTNDRSGRYEDSWAMQEKAQSGEGMTPINRYKRALHMAKEIQAYNSPS